MGNKTRRQYVYDWMDLPTHRKVEKLRELGIFEEGDFDIPGDKQDVAWISRAKERGLSEALLGIEVEIEVTPAPSLSPEFLWRCMTCSKVVSTFYDFCINSRPHCEECNAEMMPLERIKMDDEALDALLARVAESVKKAQGESRSAPPSPEEFILAAFPGANLDTLEINARLVARWLARSDERIFLTRRNLSALLSKLDRKKAGEWTACSIVKKDNQHSEFPQTMARCMVTAVEDEDYYSDREPGVMHPADTVKGE